MSEELRRLQEEVIELKKLQLQIDQRLAVVGQWLTYFKPSIAWISLA